MTPLTLIAHELSAFSSTNAATLQVALLQAHGGRVVIRYYRNSSPVVLSHQDFGRLVVQVGGILETNNAHQGASPQLSGS